MSVRPRWIVALAILAAGAVWVGASELETPARALTVALVALLPALLLTQARLSDAEVAAIPVVSAYVSSMVLIWALGIAATSIGLGSGMSPADLGLVPIDVVRALAWTGGLTVTALAILVSARLAGARETPLLRKLLPRTPLERGLFVLLSLSAGVGEELAFRGFLQPALTTATGSVAVGLLLASIAFGMLHSYQHTAGVLRASLLGALLGTSVLATGSIYPAMAAHALIDLVAGLLLADWLAGPEPGIGMSDDEH